MERESRSSPLSSERLGFFARTRGLLQYGIELAIVGYRKFISPLFPPSCRFYPTCSEYALEAVRKFGPLKGSWMSLKRILRCHPWNPGGFDPVP
jgi:uncharacterized protein